MIIVGMSETLFGKRVSKLSKEYVKENTKQIRLLIRCTELLKGRCTKLNVRLIGNW